MNEIVESNPNIMFLKGMIRASKSLSDKSIMIENEIGVEFLYTLIAIGKSESEIAEALGMSESDLNYVLCQTTAHRNKLIMAKSFVGASMSIEVLNQRFANMTEMDREQKAAADYHSNTVNRVLKHGVDNNQSAGLIINNILNVREGGEVPEIPNELEGIIDVTS